MRQRTAELCHPHLHFCNLHELIRAQRQLTVVCARMHACVCVSGHVVCNLTSKIKNLSKQSNRHDWTEPALFSWKTVETFVVQNVLEC